MVQRVSVIVEAKKETGFGFRVCILVIAVHSGTTRVGPFFHGN